MKTMIGNLIKRSTDWYSGSGYRSDIIISSRIRIARNLEEFTFPHCCSEDVLRQIEEKILKKIFTNDDFKNSEVYGIDEIDDNDSQILMERNLISKEFLKKRGRILIVSKDNPFSIILNEEDHIRMQAFSCGLELEKSWNLIERLDHSFEELFKCAYHKKYGYLTSCPTNTGTGIRASVMIHLPALVFTKKIASALKAANQIGLSVRGFHGEGTETLGNMYQISNQMSLGHTEEEIIEKIEGIAKSLVNYEDEAREMILQKSKYEIEDTVCRSYGILKHCRKGSARESYELLSNIRLGVSLGLIKNLTMKKVNELFFLIQHAHVKRNMNSCILNNIERFAHRASIIRKELN